MSWLPATHWEMKRQFEKGKNKSHEETFVD